MNNIEQGLPEDVKKSLLGTVTHKGDTPVSESTVGQVENMYLEDQARVNKMAEDAKASDTLKTKELSEQIQGMGDVSDEEIGSLFDETTSTTSTNTTQADGNESVPYSQHEEEMAKQMAGSEEFKIGEEAGILDEATEKDIDRTLYVSLPKIPLSKEQEDLNLAGIAHDFNTLEKRREVEALKTSGKNPLTEISDEDIESNLKFGNERKDN